MGEGEREEFPILGFALSQIPGYAAKAQWEEALKVLSIGLF